MAIKAERDLDKYPNPWYKEPWPWILMSGPILAIIGCIITIYLAFSQNIDNEIKLQGYIQGKFVSRDGKDIPHVFTPKAEESQQQSSQ